jgi:hypothetical protein
MIGLGNPFLELMLTFGVVVVEIRILRQWEHGSVSLRWIASLLLLAGLVIWLP